MKISGFKPGLQLGINECATTTDDSGSGCDLGAIKIITSAPDGTGSAMFNVKVGPFGADKIVCTALKAPEHCLISVGELTAEPDAQRSNDVPLQFAGLIVAVLRTGRRLRAPSRAVLRDRRMATLPSPQSVASTGVVVVAATLLAIASGGCVSGSSESASRRGSSTTSAPTTSAPAPGGPVRASSSTPTCPSGGTTPPRSVWRTSCSSKARRMCSASCPTCEIRSPSPPSTP